MKNIYEEIYLSGFDDGEEFAHRFCNLNKQNVFSFPDIHPKSAGYLIEKSLSNNMVVGFISAVSSIQKYRNKGYASKVIKKILFEAAKRNYPFVYLSPANAEFYSKFGFFNVQYSHIVSINGSEEFTVSHCTQNDIKEIEKLFSESLHEKFGVDVFQRLEDENSYFGSSSCVVKDGSVIKAFFVKENEYIYNAIDPYDTIKHCKCFNGYKYKAIGGDNVHFQIRIIDPVEFLEMLCANIDFDFSVNVNDKLLKNDVTVRIIGKNGYNLTCEKNCLSIKNSIDINHLYEWLTVNGYVKPLNTKFIEEY